MTGIASLFCSLQGKWAFSRLISGEGSVNGIATFTKSTLNEKTLYYRETGVFTQNNGCRFNVSRNYHYHYHQQEDTISVYFAEELPRLFQTLKFTTPTTAIASHLCKCDTYNAIYTFHSEDEFSIFYSVLGPKKNYTMTTIFNRSLN